MSEHRLEGKKGKGPTGKVRISSITEVNWVLKNEKGSQKKGDKNITQVV
jgi:hypothetical protein